MPKSRRRRRSEVNKKLVKFAEARTVAGKANYLIDVADEIWPDALRDEASHFIAELVLGRGPPIKRVIRWGRKFWKYRGIRTTS